MKASDSIGIKSIMNVQLICKAALCMSVRNRERLRIISLRERLKLISLRLRL